ncbi:MAG TPA: transglycosylase domain-containing protein, partial [Bacilli bacterium]|nr:transglycosylase domain-containing protein [Bacilli bacterium]
MKFKKNILLIAKYLFIVSILGFILLFIFLSVYSKRFAYSIPEVMNIELYDNQGNKFLSLSNGNKQSYITLDQISPYLIDAFISIEDKKFFNHQGIDLLRIGGALLANIKAGEITQGASTITQQYARNLFLTQDKNIKRKIDEIFIAINLENKYSKEEILEGYLNSIYFDHGIYGVEDASLFYFNKHAKDLSLAEAAMIAAIPKGPGYYSPIKNYENNKRRKELIIKELLKDKKITIEEANQALQEEPKLYGIPPQTNEYNAPYFQDLIMEEIKKILVITPAKRQSYKVYTTLDISLNKTLEECIEKYYP